VTQPARATSVRSTVLSIGLPLALSLGFVEGRPAILIRNPQADNAVRGFMLLDWRRDLVAGIRDFRHASYCLEKADIRAIAV